MKEIKQRYFNDQREKSFIQKMGEADGYATIAESNAEGRLKTSTGGANPQPMQNFAEAEKGLSRDDIAELEAILEHNDQREKSFTQKMGEARGYATIAENAAKERQGERTDILQNFAQCDGGKSRDAIAEHVGTRRD